MPQFMVGEDGLMTEKSVLDLAAWYHSQCPETDELSFEVHLMLMRALTAVTVGSQFEVRGGLSRARYNVLRILHQSPDNRLLMSEIVDLMNVSPTNITKLVDGLVNEGQVRRVSHAEDKRKTWAELTEKGREVVEGMIPNVGAHAGWLWSGMSEDEKRLLIHLLAKFRLHVASAEAEERVSESIEAARRSNRSVVKAVPA